MVGASQGKGGDPAPGSEEAAEEDAGGAHPWCEEAPVSQAGSVELIRHSGRVLNAAAQSGDSEKKRFDSKLNVSAPRHASETSGGPAPYLVCVALLLLA